MIDVVKVNPDLRAAAVRTAEAPFYRIERVDDARTADRILDLVASARPEWKRREAPRRRA
jgi:hypothetical protein